MLFPTVVTVKLAVGKPIKITLLISDANTPFNVAVPFIDAVVVASYILLLAVKPVTLNKAGVMFAVKPEGCKIE